MFCDIRGFTAFAKRAEPEEVMALLRDYHAAMGAESWSAAAVAIAVEGSAELEEIGNLSLEG